MIMECNGAYENKNYERLFELSDKLLKVDVKSQYAISYKSIAYIFLNQPEGSGNIKRGYQTLP